MTIRRVFEGEDVPLRVAYTDDAGNATAADAAPTITITDPDGNEVVSAASMDNTVGGTGESEYVWDTASGAEGAGTGTYTIEVTAEFGSETKINRRTISVE